MISVAIKLMLPYGCTAGWLFLKRKAKRSYWYLKISDSNKYNITQNNKVFERLHSGRRCFIIGTGISINEVDLSLLKDEHKIFLSEAYLHKDYEALNPSYHLFNSLGGHPTLDRERVLNHYRQADAMIPNSTTLFFRYEHDHAFIKHHNLFKNKQVFYISYDSSISYLSKDGLDATRYFYSPAGSVIAALQLALYMGFKEVYLLGVDQNYYYVASGASVYFYQDERFRRAYTVINQDLGPTGLPQSYKASELIFKYKTDLEVFEHHTLINQYAKQLGVSLYNCSAISILDIYPFRRLEELFQKSND